MYNDDGCLVAWLAGWMDGCWVFGCCSALGLLVDLKTFLTVVSCVSLQLVLFGLDMWVVFRCSGNCGIKTRPKQKQHSVLLATRVFWVRCYYIKLTRDNTQYI